MAQLTGNTIASTYLGVLSVSGAVGATTLESVTDGAGTATSLSLSQQKAKILLGTDSGDDFTINDGSNDILLIEGDTKDVTVLDDFILISDSSVIKMGAGADATFTHDGTTGLTIAASPISINSTGDLTLDSSTDIILDADGDNITMKAGSTGSGLDFIQSGTGNYTIKNLTSDKDIIFNINDGGSDTEVMRIDGSVSSVGIGSTGPGAKLQIKVATEDMLKLEQDGNTFTGDIINVQADVSGGSGWRAFLLQSNVDSSTVTEAKIDGGGVAYFHASPVSIASDYAEYFESSDGSAISLGTSVVLVDGKVRAASSGETPFGVVSSTTGNGSAWNHWDKRFIKTDYNAYDLDENGHRKQNPDYVENLDEDGEQIYVSREDRDEWNSIGLLGQVPITKGQLVASSWIKMWEISDSVDMYYIFPCS